MTTKKFSSGAVKDFQVGDFPRGNAGNSYITWIKSRNSTCGVVKISGIQAFINLLEYHPQKDSIHPKTKRRILLDEIEPLDIEFNDQHHTKSSRGLSVSDRVRDRIAFGTIGSLNFFKGVTIAWDKPRPFVALTPKLLLSPSAASSTLIPSVNNYSRGVLKETKKYASVIPLELKSDARERNKKVLGDFNYLASVIPLELKQPQNLVLGETKKYAPVIPLELDKGCSLVLGDKQNNSFPLELEPTTKGKASGWLERYTKTKKLSSGMSATYPRVQGERDPDNSEHWYWAYRWEEKRDTAKSDNGYVTRAVSLPKNKVEAVSLAIARSWSQEKILNFIRGEV